MTLAAYCSHLPLRMGELYCAQSQAERRHEEGSLMGKLHLVGRATIPDGQAEKCKACHADCAANVKATEPGTSRYESFISEDGKEMVFLETYADSDAVLAHATNPVNSGNQLLSIAQLTSLELFGDPSPQVRAALEPFGAKFYPFVAGVEG
jgi:quinol monooxygenase YgiN